MFIGCAGLISKSERDGYFKPVKFKKTCRSDMFIVYQSDWVSSERYGYFWFKKKYPYRNVRVSNRATLRKQEKIWR